MKIKLLLLLLLTAAIPALAQTGAVRGQVVDASTGTPIPGVLVMLQEQGLTVTTGPAGDFLISNVQPGNASLITVAPDYSDGFAEVDVVASATVDAGVIKITNLNAADAYYEEAQDMWLDEHVLDDEEGSAQSITALTSSSDDIYYNASNFDFQPMYFRYRGYDSQYKSVYINGIEFNSVGRGRFNYSMLGGMTSRAFRNQSATVGTAAAAYGFGDIGGTSNFNTVSSNYSPGFYGSLAYTNSNYMLRAMAIYSTGMNKKGWALTVSAIGRYANEGVQPGSFYNSFGAFLSLEKRLNENHSLSLTAFAAPTQRAGGSATYLEAYELAGNNLYNPNWGYMGDGRKRSARIVETFDPTAILNWLYKKDNTTVNTGIAAHFSHYSTSALNWYNAADPRPDYYRYLPSYYYEDGEPTEASDYYTELWADPSFRQINWGKLYQTNYMNNEHDATSPYDMQKGSTYIQENRVSQVLDLMFNSYVNHRLNDVMTLQGGVALTYSKGNYFKTVRDLLGGGFWRDIDSYSERDFPGDPEILQNDLNNPNRRVKEGDRFGYDYSIHAIKASAWVQNMINLPQWDINYGLKVGYTQFYRVGHMRNGRAPENSYGKGVTHRFDNGSIKAGATYKLDGRNYFSAHVSYGTHAPLYEFAYISPRIKDDAIDGLTNERIFSADLSYTWNYRRFRGAITGFWTEMFDMTERSSFYDDQYQTFMNYVLKGVHRSYKGIEIGMAYKLTPSVTVTAAGTVSSYLYKNRPIGVRSYENGMMPDTAQVVYLKNFHVGGTPQTAATLGVNWAAPKNWFLELSGSWMGNAYVSLSPIRHEALPDLWQHFPNPDELEAKMESLAQQDKLNDAFVMNASIGKVIYINRKVQLNLNLNVFNLLNNRNIMTNAYQQGRFDYTNYDAGKYPNKYQYAQGARVMFNAGIRF